LNLVDLAVAGPDTSLVCGDHRPELN